MFTLVIAAVWFCRAFSVVYWGIHTWYCCFAFQNGCIVRTFFVLQSWKWSCISDKSY